MNYSCSFDIAANARCLPTCVYRLRIIEMRNLNEFEVPGTLLLLRRWPARDRAV
jgi:hypothetical protein